MVVWMFHLRWPASGCPACSCANLAEQAKVLPVYGIFDCPSLGSYADVWALSPDSENFEEQVARSLAEEFTDAGYDLLKRRIFEFQDGCEICPDVVVVVQATEPMEVECVADAKLRKELRPEHVRKVVTYRERLGANFARIYVPPDCQISQNTRQLATDNQIEIRYDLDPC